MSDSDNADYDTAGSRSVLIAGPTASGKSALALALAERDGGVVINADASQVYACWRVLTARPDATDLARVPHALYGHVGCRTRYTVGDWLREVEVAIRAARDAGRRPIVVGGTGLYFRALTRGLAEIPAIPPELRARSQEMIEDGGIDRLLAELVRLDRPTYDRIDRRNPVRVQRAWEVVVATGRGLSGWHGDPHRPLVTPDDAVTVILEPEISLNNRDIGLRLQKMVAEGALDEVAAFRAAGVAADSPAARVLGAPQLLAHLRGELDLDAAIGASVVATRRFAKRQRTWFRNQMPAWRRLDPADGIASIPFA